MSSNPLEPLKPNVILYKFGLMKPATSFGLPKQSAILCKASLTKLTTFTDLNAAVVESCWRELSVLKETY
jgi:hypothetical protein